MAKTIVYVAASTDAATAGAATLEATASSLDVVTATDAEAVEARAGTADCIVFAETPTTPAGATVLEVIEAAAGTPLVLYTDSAFDPTMARATDGIDGYVRSDEPGAVSHLADEIHWICDGDATADRAAGGDTDALALTNALLECSDRRRAARLIVEAIDDLEPVEHAWVAERPDDGWSILARSDANPPGLDADTRPDDDELAALTAELAPDMDARSPAVEQAITPERTATTRTAVAIPVSETAVLQADWEGTTGDGTLDRIEWLATILSTTFARLKRERRHERAADQLATGYQRAAARAGRLETERDRFESWFDALSDPVLAYAVEDGQAVCAAVSDGFESTFGVDRDRVRGVPVTAVLGALDASTDGTTVDERLTAAMAKSVVDDPIDWRCETAQGPMAMELAVTPVYDGDSADELAAADAPAGLVYLHAVTDERRSERRLAAARERLESVGELLETDARPSLNVARGYLELAEETGDAADFAEVDEAHEGLREAIDHLARLAGRDAAIVETASLTLSDLAHQAWLAVDTGGARLELNRDARFEGDRDRLRAVFEHLFEVATTDTGGSSTGAPVVTVGATGDGFYVAGTAVSDRSDPLAGRTAAADGTGIRLGRVERVAEAHGWQVGVAEGEEGTAFAFRGVDVFEVE